MVRLARIVEVLGTIMFVGFPVAGSQIGGPGFVWGALAVVSAVVAIGAWWYIQWGEKAAPASDQEPRRARRST